MGIEKYNVIKLSENNYQAEDWYNSRKIVVYYRRTSDTTYFIRSEGIYHDIFIYYKNGAWYDSEGKKYDGRKMAEYCILEYLFGYIKDLVDLIMDELKKKYGYVDSYVRKDGTCLNWERTGKRKMEIRGDGINCVVKKRMFGGYKFGDKNGKIGSAGKIKDIEEYLVKNYMVKRYEKLVVTLNEAEIGKKINGETG